MIIKFLINLYFKLFQKFAKVNLKKIVLINFGGESYGCNPKYIAEEILRQNLNFELIWLSKNPEEQKCFFPDKIKLVDFASITALKQLQTAGFIISNVRLNYFIEKGFKKKKEQFYIQTWHGSLGFKKIDQAVQYQKFANSRWCHIAPTDSSYTNLLLSNSTFETETVMKQSFWYNGEIAQIGHPRNDVFFYPKEKKEEIRNKVLDTYGIEHHKKVVLYIPSFRDDYRLNCYELNTNELLGAMEDKFGGDWVLMIRMHPRLKGRYEETLFRFNKYVVDATYYPDIQEILVAGDAAITDYSSCIFDFMLSRKPAFVYASDKNSYNVERGFYYPLSGAPFPIAENNNELVVNIKTFNLTEYQNKVNVFVADKGCMEDGLASLRVVERIKQIINASISVNKRQKELEEHI